MEGGGGEGGRWLEDEGGGDEKHSEDAVIIHEDDDQQIGSDEIQELLPEPPKSEDRGSNAKDFSDLLSDPDECIQDTCDGNGESETSDDLDVSNSDTINDVGLNDQEEYEDILPEYGDENASKNEDEDLDYPTTTAAIELEEDDKLMSASELENDYQDEEENLQNEEQQDPDYEEYENESGSQDGSQEPEDSDPPLDETDEIINDEEQQFIAEEREILDYEETANDEEEDKEFEKQQLLFDESEQALGKELLEEKREDDIVQSLDYEEHDSFHEEKPIDDRSQTREQNNRLQLDKGQVEVIGNESAEENGKLRLNNQNIRRQATKNENRGHNPNSKLHNEVKTKSRNKLKHKSSSTESALQNQSPKLPSNINRPQANNSSNLSTKRLLQTHQGNPGRLTQNQVHHTKINKTKNHHNHQQQQQQLNLQRIRRPVLRAQLVKSLRRVTGKNQGNSTDTKNKNSVSLEGTSLEHPIVMMSLLSGSYLKCPVCSKPDPKGLCRPVFWCGLWSITRAQA